MRKILLFSFCLIQSIAFSQEPVWGPTVKVKNSFNQKILGETDKDVFLLTSDKNFKGKKNNLLRFSNDLSIKNELKLEFKEKADAFVDAYIMNDVIRTIYFNKKSKLIYEDFNFSGSFKNRKEITISEIVRDVFRPMGASYVRFSYFKSDDNSVQCISQKNYLIIIDNKQEIVRTINFEGSELIDVYVANENVYYLLGANDNIHLHKSDFKQSDEKLKLTFPNYKMWEFSLNYSKSDDKLYITSLYGPRIKKRKALGVHVNLIDKAELTELMTSKQKFNDETLLAVSTKKNVKDVDGLTNLEIRNTFYENGRFILVIEEAALVTITKKSGTGANTNIQSSTKYSYKDIILLSITDNECFQKVIERSYLDYSKYLYMMSSFSTYKNGKLYLAYHQQKVRYHFNHYVFDSSLNQEFHEEVDTYKLRGIYYGVNEGIDSKDNSVLFYGRYQKDVGLARIKLK